MDGQFFPRQRVQFEGDGQPRDVRAKAGTFTWTTAAAGNNIVVNGLGFRPKAIFFFVGAPSTVDVVGEASYSMSIGFAISASERYCASGFAAGASATTSTGRVIYNNAIAALWTNVTTIEALLDFVSMDDDGFTVAIDDATGTARSVGYLALGGFDLLAAATGAISEPAATGNQDITGLGFQPDFVFSASGPHTAYASPQVTRNLVLGWANASNQTVSGTQDVHGNGTVATRSYQRLSEFLAFTSTSAGVIARATFSSFLSDGFRINWAERSNTGFLYPFLALKGLRTKIGTLNTRTDGNNIVVTGLGFRPKAVFFHGLSIPESALDTTDTSTWEKFSVGAASGPADRFAIAHRQDPGSDPSDIARGIEHDEVYMEITTTAATLVSLMDLVSLDADGFTCVMDDVDASARLVNYIAFG